MTEEIQQSVDVQSSVNSEPSQSYASSNDQTPTEKMLSQSEVNNLVGKVKHEAYERGKRESLGGMKPSEHVQQNTFGGMPQQMTEEHIAKIVNESLHNFSQEAQRTAQEAHARRQAEEITGSLAQKCLSVPDFEQKMQGFEWQGITPFIPSLASKDNPGEILLELKENPEKIAQLAFLQREMPAAYEKKLNDLSQSIKMNQMAGKRPTAREPLSQITPSVTGKDSGSLTVKDLRNHPKFRV
jgi:hypothetical protein